MAISKCCLTVLMVFWQTVQASVFAAEVGLQIHQHPRPIVSASAVSAQAVSGRWRIRNAVESSNKLDTRPAPKVRQSDSRPYRKITQDSQPLETTPIDQATVVVQTGFRWFGTASVKNNYVFSTGTRIDDKPVLQLWARGILSNGFFIDLWSNVPLSNGNPRRSAEIDYSIGYTKEFDALGEVTATLTYYDIQTPDVFNFKNDVWGPVLKWKKGNFYSEGMYFFVDGDRDGFRVVNSLSKALTPKLKLWGNLNYADGPFLSQQAVIGKLGLSYYNPDKWLNSIGIEVSDILFAKDDNDTRGFAATFTMSKDFF